MPVLLEILKNLLIKLPPVKSFAKKRHVTGVNQSDKGVETIYNLYNKYSDFKIITFYIYQLVLKLN